MDSSHKVDLEQIVQQMLQITGPGVGGDYHQMKIAREHVAPFALRIIRFYEDRRVISEEKARAICQKVAEYVAQTDPRARVLLAEKVWSLTVNGWSTIEGGDRMPTQEAFQLQNMRGFTRAMTEDITAAREFL